MYLHWPYSVYPHYCMCYTVNRRLSCGKYLWACYDFSGRVGLMSGCVANLFVTSELGRMKKSQACHTRSSKTWKKSLAQRECRR